MSREAIFEASVEYFLSPIGAYLDDPTVTELMVNRFDQVYIERDGRLHLTDARFESEDALLTAVHNVAQWVGRDINTERPILDARLPDGSRVHAIIPPGCRAGTCLTIRKFKRGGLSLEDLEEYGSISPAAREFLEICVKLHKNIMISGGTGTGKTSLLGAVSSAIPQQERIVVIEDTAELKLRQPHCIYLEVQRPDQFGRGGLSIRQLFVASLRMRPDRILVGEVRAGEALDMVQSMLSGHSGSLSTVHANSARDAVVRLETLSLDERRRDSHLRGAGASRLGDRPGGATQPLFGRRLAASSANYRGAGARRKQPIPIARSFRLPDGGHRPRRQAHRRFAGDRRTTFVCRRTLRAGNGRLYQT